MLHFQNFTVVGGFFCFLFNVMGKILHKPWGQIPVFAELVSRAVKRNLILWFATLLLCANPPSMNQLCNEGEEFFCPICKL